MELKTMNSRFYRIKINNDIMAENMSLQIALVLVKAMYEEFYNEPDLVISIERYDKDTKTYIEEVKE